MLTIDGSQGEGGGQIPRTALAVALVTQQPVCIVNIRAGRRKPGLMRQHLTAVEAAARIGRAEVSGASIGSCELTFRPTEAAPGEYRFAVGTAGSTTLVLQTILPALLTARGPSQLTLEGGTHNPHAPPFDFLQKTFLPLINRMGPNVTATLERPGFYPAGGGKCTITVAPTAALQRTNVLERGRIRRRRATALVAGLPRHIAARELRTVRAILGWDEADLHIDELAAARGPGNVVSIEIECAHVTEVFTGFGRRGVPAETVAKHTADAARRYLTAGVPVGPHLADQLLLPLALAGGGSFHTLPLTPHATTNIDVIRQFLNVDMAVDSAPDGTVCVQVRRR